jgi:hypothetical protein
MEPQAWIAQFASICQVKVNRSGSRPPAIGRLKVLSASVRQCIGVGRPIPHLFSKW